MCVQVVYDGGAYLQLLFQTGPIGCAADVVAGPRERLANDLAATLVTLASSGF